MVSRGYPIDNEALREIRDSLQESKKREVTMILLTIIIIILTLIIIFIT